MTATVTLLRESIERRIAELKADAAAEFAVADALHAHGDDHMRNGSRIQSQVDELRKKLREADGA